MANTAAKKITYDGKPVQVESAVRDGTGKVINETYVMKPKIIEYDVPATITAVGYWVIADYNGTYDGTPGHIRFTMEVTSSAGDTNYKGAYDVNATWGGSNCGITLLSGNASNSDIYEIGINTSNGIELYTYNASMRSLHVKITVYESTLDLTWKTAWDTGATPLGPSVNTYYMGDIHHASESTKAITDYTNDRIDTSYVRFAEYTVPVSTSQQYHKAFSDLALGTNSAGQARKPRQVEIYDPSGNQIQTDVTIDLTNSRITIYPTAVSPAQTWTVRVTAW